VARSAAAIFSEVSTTGTTAAMFSAGPTLVPGFALARIAWTARPWASTAWWRTWFKRAGGSLRPGCEQAGSVTQFDERGQLVDREEILDPVAEFLTDVTGIIRKGFRSVARFPSADAVLERLRQVPVIERRERLDTVSEQLIHQAVVKIQASGIWNSSALRKDTWPGDRESVRPCPQRLHQLHVFPVAMVVIQSYVASWLFSILPRECANLSQTDSPLPSSFHAPSI